MPNEEEDKYDDYEIIQNGGEFPIWAKIILGVATVNELARLFYCYRKNSKFEQHHLMPWPIGIHKLFSCQSTIEDFIKKFLKDFKKELKTIARKRTYIMFKFNKDITKDINNYSFEDLSEKMIFLTNASEKIIKTGILPYKKHYSFFELISTDWNNKSIKYIYNKIGRETAARIFFNEKKDDKIKKKPDKIKKKLAEYISFDTFFCTILDVIIDGIIDYLRYDICAGLHGKKIPSYLMFQEWSAKLKKIGEKAETVPKENDKKMTGGFFETIEKYLPSQRLCVDKYKNNIRDDDEKNIIKYIRKESSKRINNRIKINVSKKKKIKKDKKKIKKDKKKKKDKNNEDKKDENENDDKFDKNIKDSFQKEMDIFLNVDDENKSLKNDYFERVNNNIKPLLKYWKSIKSEVNNKVEGAVESEDKQYLMNWFESNGKVSNILTNNFFDENDEGKKNKDKKKKGGKDEEYIFGENLPEPIKNFIDDLTFAEKIIKIWENDKIDLEKKLKEAEEKNDDLAYIQSDLDEVERKIKKHKEKIKFDDKFDELKINLNKIFLTKYKISSKFDTIVEFLKNLDIKDVIINAFLNKSNKELTNKEMLLAFKSHMATAEYSVTKIEKKKINICNKIMLLKPLNWTEGMIMDTLNKGKLLKTKKVYKTTKDNICEDFLEALIIDILTPLKKITSINFNIQKIVYDAMLKCEEKHEKLLLTDPKEYLKQIEECFLLNIKKELNEQKNELEKFMVVFKRASGDSKISDNILENKKLIKKDLDKKKTAVHNRLQERLKNKKIKKDAKIKQFEVKKGGGVIAAGSYGCIFRPHLSCKTGKEVKNSNFVTKLMVDREWRIEREIEISNKIMSIPNYSNYFSPLLEVCSLSSKKIKNINKENDNKCNILNNINNKEVSKLAKIKYIEGGELLNIITKSNSIENFSMLLTIYEQSLECIHLLIKQKIVHYDLHSKNIMFNKKLKRTIFIDFGLTFDISKIINYKQLSNIFYAPDSYNYTLWPIEVHYITFLIWEKKKMNKNDIDNLAKEYFEEHSAFKIMEKNNSFDTIKKIYIKKAKKILTIINKLEYKKAILYVIKNAWKTWDNYALSLEIFVMLYTIGNTNKQLKELLYKNLSPNFKERLSIKETKILFKNIKKNISPKEFLSLSTNIKQIKKSLTLHTKKTLIHKKKLQNIFLNIF